jgi:hypothetical protein
MSRRHDLCLTLQQRVLPDNQQPSVAVDRNRGYHIFSSLFHARVCKPLLKFCRI